MLDRQKLETAAQLIEGRVATDENPSEVYIKGTVLGFPAILQAIFSGWPFGVTYIIETKVVDDPSKVADATSMTMTIVPRMAHGFLKTFTRIFLLEPSGVPVGDKRVQEKYLVTTNNVAQSDRFFRYPGVYDSMVKLEKMTKFTEIVIKAEAGLSLSQPKSFNALELDVCKETFRSLAELGQILFESFS
jgi:hypothetical protein